MPITCEYCEKEFSNRMKYAEHKLKNHKKEITEHEKDEMKRILRGTFKQKQSKTKSSGNKIIWMGVLVIIVVAITGYFLFFSSPTGKIVDKIKTSNMAGFTQCLNKSSVLYTTSTCSVCKQQKQLFGSNLKFLKVVECDSELELCQALEIQKVPTWIINGKRYTGKKSLEQLSDLSLCGLPG